MMAKPLLAFDPLVVDVLCDPATMWAPQFGAYMRKGVLYYFAKAEIERAVVYFNRNLPRR